MDDKLSYKMLLFEHSRLYDEHNMKCDKDRYDANLIDEVIALEDENEKLKNGNKDEINKQLYQLEQTINSKDNQIQELKERIDRLEMIKADLERQKEIFSKDIKHYDSTIESLSKRNEELESKANELQVKLNKLVDPKCYDCDSFKFQFNCKCNDTLGYAYCTKQNGYKGYRKVIKEME